MLCSDDEAIDREWKNNIEAEAHGADNRTLMVTTVVDKYILVCVSFDVGQILIAANLAKVWVGILNTICNASKCARLFKCEFRAIAYAYESLN